MSVVKFARSSQIICTSGQEKPFTALAGELSYMSGGPWCTPLNITRARICFGLGGVIEQISTWTNPLKHVDGWGVVKRIQICQ